MAQLDTWTRFVRDITAWQARNGHGPVGLSTDPADYVNRSTDGDTIEFVRCPATPPPFKYESQQCDQVFGHSGPHWFDDGWFRHKWTEPHMAWCGLDTDHQGMCHPPFPDHGEKGQPEEDTEVPREPTQERTEALLVRGGIIVLKEVIEGLTDLLAKLEEIE